MELSRSSASRGLAAVEVARQRDARMRHRMRRRRRSRPDRGPGRRSRTCSSVMRLTKLELAPFSSRRRTRYGSRSSCEPTGAYTRQGTSRRSAGMTSAYRSSPMPCSFWNSKSPSRRAVARACDGSRRSSARCAWRTSDRSRRVAVEQAARVGQVGHVGVRLAREHRIAGLALDLRALDLAVPVRALDQAHRDAPAQVPRQVARCSRSRTARASGTPARRGRSRPSRRSEASASTAKIRSSESSSRSVSSASMVRPMPCVLRQLRQLEQVRRQFGEHALALGVLVARMQRGQLDRDRGAANTSANGPLRADRVDRLAVGLQVAHARRRRSARLRRACRTNSGSWRCRPCASAPALRRSCGP